MNLLLIPSSIIGLNHQVWMDPPAAPNSLHPMVNDLNLKALSPNKKTIYPNGLNEEDSINNVEVIHGEFQSYYSILFINIVKLMKNI